MNAGLGFWVYRLRNLVDRVHPRASGRRQGEPGGAGEPELLELVVQLFEIVVQIELVALGDGELGFVVVAMVWQPGQETPVHDHSGIWCVEGVLEGSVRITQYDPVEDGSPAGSFQLRQSGRFESRIGDTGRLIPPFEFHKIENVGDRTAITLHVYGKDLVNCQIFEDLGSGSFAAKSIQMQYNPAALQG